MKAKTPHDGQKEDEAVLNRQVKAKSGCLILLPGNIFLFIKSIFPIMIVSPCLDNITLCGLQSKAIVIIVWSVLFAFMFAGTLLVIGLRPYIFIVPRGVGF